MQNSYVPITYGRTVELHLTDSGKAIIDENARKAFMCGQCHSLALAIHLETGWPIYGVGGTDESPDHCVVYSPLINDFIDINGIGAEDRNSDWFEYNRVELSPDDIPNLAYYVPANVEAAKPFAKKVLQSLPPKARQRTKRRKGKLK